MEMKTKKEKLKRSGVMAIANTVCILLVLATLHVWDTFLMPAVLVALLAFLITGIPGKFGIENTKEKAGRTYGSMLFAVSYFLGILIKFGFEWILKFILAYVTLVGLWMCGFWTEPAPVVAAMVAIFLSLALAAAGQSKNIVKNWKEV